MDIDKKIDNISEGLKKATSFFFWIAVDLLNMFLRLIVIGGAIGSFCLLYKFYPEAFFKIMDVAYPIITIIWAFVKASLTFTIICGVLFLGIKLGCFMADHVNKSKDRREKSREKFLDDLANKMNKRLKKR